MNKDIIYIDTEDDITAIIGKVKNSKEKIVALVPPKRTGVLQSSVNLHLLARAADNAQKHLVVITNNKALIGLTAAARIPVAKNLQSKPEIAEIAALDIDEGDDIIEGSQLPVGELEKTADKIDNTATDKKVVYVKTASKKSDNAEVADVIETIDIDDNDPEPMIVRSSVPLQQQKQTDQTPKNKSDIKVPNFSKFRKKFFIIFGLVVVLIGFLVWAIKFAPAATVVITANTESAGISKTITLGGTANTDLDNNIIQSVSKSETEDVSVEFTATGSSEVGENAKGSVVFSNCDTLTQETISSGTYISLAGKNYITQEDVTVGAGQGTFSTGCTSAGTSVAVNVVAANIGSSYNTVANAEFTVSGYGTGMTATSATGITGGSSHQATVVSATDIQTAKEALAKKIETEKATYKKKLTAEFVNGELVIADSFISESKDAVSSPTVNKELSSGKATLTSSTTFTITAISKSELEAYLNNELNKQISSSDDRKIYSSGIDDVTFSGYTKTDTLSTVNIATNGQIGPNINADTIKTQIKGKRFGDVQSMIEDIEGVSNVDVKFSYFWVNTVPNDVDKIDIQFTIAND